MNFFVFGTNHKNCPIELREKLHFDEARIRSVLPVIRDFVNVSGLVILSTCNRVEFYGLSDGAISAEGFFGDFIKKIHKVTYPEFSDFLYQYQGTEAVRHLFRVAAGLDSLVLGENEIVGQLREAFKTAQESGSLGPHLHRLMEKSLKVAKDVRTCTAINRGAMSIPSVAVELARKIFGRLDGRKIMVLGTGEMSTLTLKTLKSSGARALYVASRSEERGKGVAAEFGGEWIPSHAWEEKLLSVDILIASTTVPRPIVCFENVRDIMLKRQHQPLFLIDIGVPRNIESYVQSLEGVYLYNLDDLKSVAAENLKAREREIESADALVENAVKNFWKWIAAVALKEETPAGKFARV